MPRQLSCCQVVLLPYAALCPAAVFLLIGVPFGLFSMHVQLRAYIHTTSLSLCAVTLLSRILRKQYHGESESRRLLLCAFFPSQHPTPTLACCAVFHQVGLQAVCLPGLWVTSSHLVTLPACVCLAVFLSRCVPFFRSLLHVRSQRSQPLTPSPTLFLLCTTPCLGPTCLLSVYAPSAEGSGCCSCL
jgi:hypothetical protein